MDQIKITRLCDTISKYKQMEHSQLWDDIQAVMGCDQKVAAKLAASHCNMVSFWCMSLIENMHSLLYKDFFKYCMETTFKDEESGDTLPFVKPNGFMNQKKDKILASLGYTNFSITRFRDFTILDQIEKLDSNKFYQVSVTGHFMSAYIQKNQLYLADTMRRGIGVPAKGAYKVDKDHFIWLMPM